MLRLSAVVRQDMRGAKIEWLCWVKVAGRVEIKLANVKGILGVSRLGFANALWNPQWLAEFCLAPCQKKHSLHTADPVPPTRSF